MARMIDTLRQAGSRTTPAEQPAKAEPERADTAPALETPPAEAQPLPFIEVGGAALSASPDVLACPVPPRKAPRLVQPEAPPPAVAPAPLAVAFQPWPGPHAAATRSMAPELIAFHQPNHAVSLQYRALLDQALGGDSAGALRVLLFTSAGPDADTTTTLLNLAVCACAEGKRRVAVVDLNVQRPALAERLGLLASPGLHEVLAGSVALEQAMQVTALQSLYALTWAPPVAGQKGVPTAEAIRWVLSWLRERFDVVFVDGPPWEEGAETAALAAACDGIFPVLKEDAASRPPVQQVLRAIARRGGRLRGLIHTHRAA